MTYVPTGCPVQHGAPRNSASVTAVSRRVGAQRAPEGDFAEGRPEDFAEVVRGVGGLPEHEPGQPLLTAGADHQVRIRLGTGVEMLADQVDVDAVREVLHRGPLVGRVEDHRAHGVGDLLAAAVADGDVDDYP